MKTTKRSSRSRGRHELAASRSPAWTQRIVAFIIVAFMLCQALPGLVQLAQAAAPASNITTKMRIVSGSSEAETDAIESGAPFRVEFTYSLRPNSADQSYKGLLISIQVPDGLDIYGLTGSTDVVDGGDLDHIGASIHHIRAAGQAVYIKAIRHLNADQQPFI